MHLLVVDFPQSPQNRHLCCLATHSQGELLQEFFTSPETKKAGQPPIIKSDDHPTPISVCFYLFSFSAPGSVPETALLP